MRTGFRIIPKLDLSIALWTEQDLTGHVVVDIEFGITVRTTK